MQHVKHQSMSFNTSGQIHPFISTYGLLVYKQKQFTEKNTSNLYCIWVCILLSNFFNKDLNMCFA
jgi:hypothetical protein